MTQAKTEPITIAGRRFASVRTSTLEHDYWFAARLNRAGLDVVEIGELEDREAFVRRLLAQLLDQGAVFEMLAGVLVPLDSKDEPMEWSPKIAEGVASFLRGLRDDESKDAVSERVGELLADFFVRGLSSIVISPGSVAGAQPDARNGTSGDHAASSTSVPSASTYARSLGTTPAALERSSAAGRSARPSWRSRIAATARRWLHGSTTT